MKIMESDMTSIKAFILYLVCKRGEIELCRLHRMLYFAQCRISATYAQHFVYDDFIAGEEGPELRMLRCAACGESADGVDDGLLGILSGCLTFRDGIVSSGEMPDMDELSVVDEKTLDAIYDEYVGMDIDRLNGLSMDDAWKRGLERPGHVIDYVDIARAGGAADGLIEYIKDKEEFENYIRG